MSRLRLKEFYNLFVFNIYWYFLFVKFFQSNINSKGKMLLIWDFMKSIAKTIRKIRNGANLISDHLLFIGGYKVGIIISELKES